MTFVRVKGPIPPDSDNYYRYFIASKDGERWQMYLGPADGPNDKHVTKDEIPEKYHDDIEFRDSNDITPEKLCNSEYTEKHYQHAIKDAHIDEWKEWDDETQKHFIPVTGMFLDGWIARSDYAERAKGAKVKVVEMSPEEYQNISRESFDEYRRGGHFIPEEDNVRELQDVIQEDKRLPMLSLDYTRDFDQEGRHRALAAERENLDKVPVVVTWGVDEGVPPEIDEHV